MPEHPRYRRPQPSSPTPLLVAGAVLVAAVCAGLAVWQATGRDPAGKPDRIAESAPSPEPKAKASEPAPKVTPKADDPKKVEPRPLARADRFAAIWERNGWATGDDIHVVAEAFWDERTGEDGLVEMRATWAELGPFGTAGVAHAVRNNLAAGQLFPETVRAIRLLGGDRWLAR